MVYTVIQKDLPGRTALLTFQPASQTMKMKNVAARQLFGLILLLLLSLSRSRLLITVVIVGRLHFFSTNNTRAIVHPGKVLGCRIGIKFVHVASCSSISVQIAAFLNEWSECHIHVAYDVQRQLIVITNEDKEDDVRDKLEEILKNTVQINSLTFTSSIAFSPYLSSSPSKRHTWICLPMDRRFVNR